VAIDGEGGDAAVLRAGDLHRADGAGPVAGGGDLLLAVEHELDRRTGPAGAGVFQVTASPGPSGMVTVTAPGATNSPQQIQVNVTNAGPDVPFGSFDTPADNSSGIAGAIAVTGWALDPVDLVKVDIWRQPIGNEATSSNGLVFIGDAVFVTDARPDVEAAYPTTPRKNRAGWGYQLLTTLLPNNGGSSGLGNGTYNLHAIAHNTAGAAVDLGTRSITADNAHAAKPFGTIDTPAPGSTISGNAFVNFGWALTQNPLVIPTDGSTITVMVDGQTLGHPVYNQLRSDIAFRVIADHIRCLTIAITDGAMNTPDAYG